MLYERLEKIRDQTEWRKYERARDPRVCRKGRFGMDTHTVWFVVETIREFIPTASYYATGHLYWTNV